MDNKNPYSSHGDQLRSALPPDERTEQLEQSYGLATIRQIAIDDQ